MKAIDFCAYDDGKPDLWPEWWNRLRVNLGAAIFGRRNLTVLVEGHARTFHGPQKYGRATTDTEGRP